MSEKFTKVTERFWVAPQLTAADVADAAAQGVKLIVNNRPDGEALGQPTGAEIEAAATAAGVAYAHIPVDKSGLSAAHLDAFDAAITGAEDATVLGYCAAGARAALIHTYAAARRGAPVDELIEAAANAGFNIAGHAPSLKSLQETQ